MGSRIQGVECGVEVKTGVRVGVRDRDEGKNREISNERGHNRGELTCMSFMKLTASMTVTMESMDAMSRRDSPWPSSAQRG